MAAGFPATRLVLLLVMQQVTRHRRRLFVLSLPYFHSKALLCHCLERVLTLLLLVLDSRDLWPYYKEYVNHQLFPTKARFSLDVERRSLRSFGLGR